MVTMPTDLSVMTAAVPAPPLRLACDTGALAANWRALDGLSGAARAGAAVKADAYGTGARRAVPVLRDAGCRDFFVAHWCEAADLLDLVAPESLAMLLRLGGHIGYAVVPELRRRGYATEMLRQAVEIARANSVYQRKRISLVPVDKVVTSWKSAFEKDPFEVSIDDKIQFLLSLNEAAMKTKGVSFVNSFMGFVNEQKFYASTDGSRIEQYIVRANPSFTVTAVNRANGDFQSRSALGGPQGMGYEYIEKHDWKREAQQAGERLS